MSMSEVFTAVIVANLVTGAFIYACWRMNRDGPGLVGPAIAVLCCIFGLIMAWPTG